MFDPKKTATALVADITGDNRLILDANAPLECAREFVNRKLMQEKLRKLHHQGSEFFEWDGTHYRPIPTEQIKAKICRFLDGALRIVGQSLAAFDPTPRRVADVLAMLRAETQLDEDIRAPAWLDNEPRPPAREFFACSNGLLHLPTGILHPHSPSFFSLNAVDYAFDPSAPAPREWLAFLHTIWPKDQESIDTLQEIFGYLLTADTAQQKMFWIVGPPRSGKGTIAFILIEILGRDNVAGPTLASLSANFGLAALIGKPLAIISDARLGSRSDQSITVERLLSITGEDALTIDRKYSEPWTGRLPTRILILTNELPRLSDTSGAVASRIVLLQTMIDFLGREDRGLKARLLPERPAILNWAVDGWKRLAARGHFVQPESGRQSIQTLDDLVSPMRAFLRDRAIVGPRKIVECDRLFAEWRSWCTQQGRDYSGNVQTFGRDLRAALPSLKDVRPRRKGQPRVRCYMGVCLASKAAKPAGPADLTPGWGGGGPRAR